MNREDHSSRHGSHLVAGAAHPLQARGHCRRRAHLDHQVVVDHTRLKDAKAARRMKTYWRRRLDRLQEILEA